MMKAQMINQIEEKEQYPIHPKKFVLWLFLVGIVMLFAGLTSAYIVKKGDPKGWVDFVLPSMFLVSSVIVVLSSITMQYSVYAAKHDEIGRVKIGLGITLLLGIAFLGAQLLAASQMMDGGVYFSGNAVSFSFVYVLAGFHFFHILGGLFYLAYVWYKSFHFQVHKKNLLKISLCATYWHFVGGLWLYLYLFMLNA